MISVVWILIQYWYFRYLLVTELYMVEKWERHMIHGIFFVIFSSIAIFNWVVVLGLVGSMVQKFNYLESPLANFDDVIKNVYALFA